MNTQELLLEHFLRWQKEEGRRKTAKQFAHFIGIGEQSFNMVFNGRRAPTIEQTYIIATALNDERFYEITGHQKPDDLIKIYVEKNWGRLDQAGKKRVANIISQYTSEKPPEE